MGQEGLELLRLESQWLIPAAALVGVEQVGTIWLRSFRHLAGSQPFVNYGIAALSLCLIFGAVLTVHAAALSIRAASPVIGMRDYFAERAERLSVLLIGFALAWLQLVVLTSTKTLIPAFGTMWADPFLANIDQSMLGVDAWRLVDPFLRPIGSVIDTLYALWAIFLQFTLIAILMARPSQAKSRAMLTFFLAMAFVGVLGQFILPSGGPIFWHRLGLGDRFDALPSSPHTRMAADYLWGKYTGNTVDFATGISAFPSMHVTMTAWIVIAVHSIYPRWRVLAWLYFVVILLGSVYLGWHYLADGIGGAIGAILCWWGAGALLKPQAAILQMRTA